MKRAVLYLVLVVLISGCGSKRKIVTKRSDTPVETVRTETPSVEEPTPVVVNKPVNDSPKMNSTEAYIDRFQAIAVAEMKQYGIPASITLAQGILESGAGKGRLAALANNHFGIKCHDWTGARIYHDDDKRQECFRKYENPESSFRDHSLFLTRRKRYAALFNLRMDDYKGWARELRRAGYATDRRYPQKLIDLIERYELDRFDDKSGYAAALPQEYMVKKGDTLYAISKRFDIPLDTLKRINGLRDNAISIGQILKLPTSGQ